MKPDVVSGEIQKPSALSVEQVGAIAAEHAQLLAAVIDTAPHYPMSLHEWALVGMRLFTGDPSLYRSIIMHGCNCDRSRANEFGGFSAAFMAAEIIKLTRDAHDTPTLQAAVLAEITPYSAILSGARH